MRSARPLFTQSGWALLAAVAVLATLGLLTIYVADTAYAGRHDGPGNALRQLIAFGVSACAGAVVLRIGHQRIGRYSYLLFLVAVLALLPLLVAKLLHSDFGGLTTPRNGAYRWIRLPGFDAQPSELMKVAFILALAWYLRFRNNYRRLRGLLVPLAVSVVPLTLILFEPDLGTVLLLAVVLLALMFLAGARLRHLGLILLVGLLLAPVAWYKIRPYQRARITAVLLQSDTLRQTVIEHPERYGFLASKRQAMEWAASSGFQLVASKSALGSGGLLGHGWGKGVYVEHMSFLPDRHNDFIFALIGHQWGTVGCLLVLVGYGVLVVAGVRIAGATTEPFGRLLAVGVVVLLASQVIINVGMTLGLMPITGMTLPFVSYGGSSLLTNFIALGLLLSVSKHRPFLLAQKPFDFQPQPETRPHLAERVSDLPGTATTPDDPE